VVPLENRAVAVSWAVSPTLHAPERSEERTVISMTVGVGVVPPSHPQSTAARPPSNARARSLMIGSAGILRS
jgi:hypothetical protein